MVYVYAEKDGTVSFFFHLRKILRHFRTLNTIYGIYNANLSYFVMEMPILFHKTLFKNNAPMWRIIFTIEI